MNELWHVYLSAWPTVWVMDTARYLVAATLMATILALFWRAGLARRKLQPRDPRPGQRRREVLASLRTAFIFSVLGAIVAVGDHQGWITIYKDFRQAGPLYLVLSLALMLVAHDTYFYWAHRAMHHRRLFALFHRTHHLSRTPTPWAAYSFAIPEAVVHGAFVPLFLLVVPMHGLGLLAFGIVQILRNVMGHAGAEVHPAAFGPGRWLGWNNTTTHHDLHHEAGRYNYGLYFRWWDKLMGTEHPDYRRKFEAIVSPAAAGPAPAKPAPVLARAIMGLMAATILLLGADPVRADEGPVGRWMTPGAAAIVEISPCNGAPGLCGTVRWLWDSVDDKGRPRLDAQNVDTTLRTRPLVGLSILSGFARTPNGGWEGRIYNPEDGQTYRATLRRVSADTLTIEGCVLFICQKQVWRSAAALAAALH
ncbi:sterol desaturase family protein [Reyranella sp.]|uniref:sterol desaturase family protein n=1 Tax=Reyranella sp. TaxID=1929291 RepID=UPI003C7E3AFA